MQRNVQTGQLLNDIEATVHADFSRSLLHLWNHRRNATADHTSSTPPNGQAPCKKPYTEAITQDNENPSTYHAERDSMV